jgi:hypothetical protein
MTDPMTPLTDESEALLAEVHGTQMALTVFPARLRAIEAAAARRALEGSGVVHEPVLFDPTGPVYDSLPHPKASRYELSGALLRDQSADPLADPDAYDRRILLVTVASAARALAALPHPEEPRVERCAVCGVGRWVTAHDPEAGPSHHPFTPESR